VSRAILFVLPSLGGGGAERVVINIINHLNRERWTPVLAVCSGKGILSDLIADDVDVHYFHKVKVRKALPALILLIHKLKPDILFSTLTHLNLAVGLIRPFLPRRIRYIAREGNLPERSLAGESHPFLYKVAYRFLYTGFDAVVAQSRRMKLNMQSYNRIPDELIHVIHNPVDTQVVMEGAAKERPEWPGVGIRLLAAGRLSHQKGFDVLLHTLKGIPGPFSLVLLGEGEERVQLEALATKLGLEERVHFIGFDPNPYRWMAAADLFILSSRYEGFPNVLLEAVSCGLPVTAVTGDTSAQEIVVDGINGTLSHEPTVESLRSAVIRAMDIKWNNDRIREMAAENFSVSSIVKDYETLFERMIQKSKWKSE